jgi:hypothetical protein
LEGPISGVFFHGGNAIHGTVNGGNGGGNGHATQLNSGNSINANGRNGFNTVHGAANGGNGAFTSSNSGNSRHFREKFSDSKGKITGQKRYSRSKKFNARRVGHVEVDRCIFKMSY